MRTLVKTPRAAYAALTVATASLTVNFWAWSLISPLASKYGDELVLNPLKVSVLVALPVLVGSLGRIPLGALTDRFGGKKILIAVCLLAIIPVLGLTIAKTYNEMLGLAILLGIGGASFVAGVPFISAWFPSQKRGLALGIYAMGNAGVSVSGLLTPKFVTWIGRPETYIFVAGLLLVMALVVLPRSQEAPGWEAARTPASKRFWQAARQRITWDLSVIYAITFGAFVAFGVYLPVLLKETYGLTVTDAASRAAGFVLLATAARPLGGWLSDRFGGPRVVRTVLVAVALLASIVAFQSSLHLYTSAAYLSLAVALGCGNGAVFALLSRRTEPKQIGSVSGIVGAAGGLGGFLPPLILGLTYQWTRSYTPAFLMLSVSAIIALAYVHQRFKTKFYQGAPKI
jgi:NNP family nitrate/nitrite transporter-like MFS transporter